MSSRAGLQRSSDSCTLKGRRRLPAPLPRRGLAGFPLRGTSVCRRQGLRLQGRRAFSHCRDGTARPSGPDACRRPAGPQRSPRLASPVLPRPGQRGGLTSTTRDSLWTEGIPQPPPQQLSSMGAAILPGLTYVTRKYSYRPLSCTWNGVGRDEEQGLTPWSSGQRQKGQRQAYGREFGSQIRSCAIRETDLLGVLKVFIAFSINVQQSLQASLWYT